jgi:hypothetical protein
MDWDDREWIADLIRSMQEVQSSRMQGATTMMQVDKVLARVNGWWMEHYAANNLVEKELSFSFTDVLFMCRCSLLACKFGAESPAVEEIFPLSTELSIRSSLHLSTTSVFPGADEFHELELRVARYIHQHLQAGPAAICTELAKITPLELLKLQVPDFLRSAYESLKYVAPTVQTDDSYIGAELNQAGIARYTAEDAERDRRKRIEEEAEEKKEEQTTMELPRGWLWQTDVDSVVVNFIPLASRMLYQLNLEHTLVPKAQCQNATPVSVSQRARVHQWLMSTTSLEYNTTDFPKLLHEWAMEFRLPLGARVQGQRSTTTRADRFSTPASQLLENEVGPDMTQLLRTRITKPKPKDIASDPTHELFDVFFLCMFSYALKQALQRVNVLKEYFIHANHAEYTSFHKRIHTGTQLLRRPLMAYLQRQWWVQTWTTTTDSHWIRCTDSIHMVVEWWRLMHSPLFNGLTDRCIGLKSKLARDRWIEEVFTR